MVEKSSIWRECPNKCGGSVTVSDLERLGECVACAFLRRICPLCEKGACECSPPLHPDAARSNQRVRARIARKS